MALSLKKRNFGFTSWHLDNGLKNRSRTYASYNDEFNVGSFVLKASPAAVILLESFTFDSTSACARILKPGGLHGLDNSFLRWVNIKFLIRERIKWRGGT